MSAAFGSASIWQNPKSTLRYLPQRHRPQALQYARFDHLVRLLAQAVMVSGAAASKGKAAGPETAAEPDTTTT
jgi:hypothetical protein